MIPIAQMEKLLENGRASAERGRSLDHFPVVRIISLDTGSEWLLSERSPHNDMLAFGAFFPGDGSVPLMGWVSIPGLIYNRSRAGRLLDFDPDYRPSRPIGAIAPEVRFVGEIPSKP
ncbi:DUF2958 domain-containing protein (plasmid) [Mesorhizobium sp. AR02]|uniref:DUF2958 domain-containing protein n=1 Tax=Mesorhizobium shangrilense TaxID=460060 RepID=A0ABV2DQE9_9HYPH|nr:DUF2958 domain-containing protein [Mesorhizobium sp. AR02]UVK50252.1 DUF2958 domain-containing protein [Mesorhizobium sp. AR02]